jgi:hypothetical protein
MQLVCDSLPVETKTKTAVKTDAGLEVKPGKTSPSPVEVEVTQIVAGCRCWHHGRTRHFTLRRTVTTSNHTENLLVSMNPSSANRNSADSGALSIDANDLIGGGGGTGSGVVERIKNTRIRIIHTEHDGSNWFRR